MVRQLRTKLNVILPSRYPRRVAECCLSSAAVYANLPVPLLSSPTALTGSQAKSQAPIQGPHRVTAGGTRHRRAATEETYWAYSGEFPCLYFFWWIQSFQCGEPSNVKAGFPHTELVKPDLFSTEKKLKMTIKGTYLEKLFLYLHMYLLPGMLSVVLKQLAARRV